MGSTIRRAKKDAENPYKAIRRATFEDNRLSWEARGLLGYLLVKPDDWHISVTNLINESPGGRDRVYRILNELIEFGYIQRIEVRDKGKISGYDYLVYEEPCEGKPQQAELIPAEPLPEKPYTVSPLTEKADHTKEEVQPSKKNISPPVAEASSATHRQPEENEPPEQYRQWFGAMVKIVYGHEDSTLLSKTDRQAVGVVIKDIRKSPEGYTLDDLLRWYETKWSQEWPGKQPGKTEIQCPTLKQVKQGIGKIRALQPSVNGYHANGHVDVDIGSLIA